MKLYSAKKRGWRSKHNGFSLLDVIIASVVLIIAILGTASYRYHSALDERKAAMQTSAARAALLLCESWRGVKGDIAIGKNKGVFIGQLVANSFSAKNIADIQYDPRAATGCSAGDPLTKFVVKGWHEYGGHHPL